VGFYSDEETRMLETDRRGFLKGLFASMALVAIPAPVIAAMVPVSTVPEIGIGEIWLKVDDKWQMIGASTDFRYAADAAGFSNHMMRSQIVTDLEGREMLVDAIIDGEGRRIAFGIADGQHVESDAILVTFEETATRGERVSMMVEFVLSGKPV
jgi:hypothetical protein